MRRSGRGQGRERGASLVELALILPLLAILVFGTIDLARAYRLQVRLENAAREGAAFGQVYANQVDGCSTPGASIVDRVKLEDEDLPSHPGFTVEVFREDSVTGDLTQPHTGCGGNAVVAGERLRVDVSATFDVLTPLVENLVGGTIDMTNTAEVEVQQ